jgi:hypothetical protein
MRSLRPLEGTPVRVDKPQAQIDLEAQRALAQPSPEISPRDEAGRFIPGTSGNPLGKPPGRSSTSLVNAMREASTPEKLRSIALKLLDLAEKGNVKAIAEVCDRLDGKAIQAIIEIPQTHIQLVWPTVSVIEEGNGNGNGDGHSSDSPPESGNGGGEHGEVQSPRMRA